MKKDRRMTALGTPVGVEDIFGTAIEVGDIVATFPKGNSTKGYSGFGVVAGTTAARVRIFFIDDDRLQGKLAPITPVPDDTFINTYDYNKGGYHHYAPGVALTNHPKDGRYLIQHDPSYKGAFWYKTLQQYIQDRS